MTTAERSRSAQNARVAVQLSLTCAWCAREIEDVQAERDVASGRILLAHESERFRLLGGRPTCSGCGGPLFVEDWRPSRRPTPINPEIFSGETSETKTEEAA
ncbi:MAG: hypothetical protein HY534_00265 [Chloroflexi bacterium]|nr:hypothetical protein [Chloroflexota bacterium]